MVRSEVLNREPKFTDFDRNVLRGLCRQPWGNDREISEDVNVRMSTVTASKNRMKQNKIFCRAYLPAYHRLGYSLISFSQIKLSSTAGFNFGSLNMNGDTKTIVPFFVHDSVNAFIIAYHSTFSDYRNFERQIGLPWQSELQVLEGAMQIVNFDFTNTINKVFFPKAFENDRPIVIDTDPFKFGIKLHRTAFNGLVKNPEKLVSDLVKPLGITRQSIVKIRKMLKTNGILDRTVLVDFEKIGLRLLSLIRINSETASEKDIFIINKALKPIFYWNFEKTHYMLTGNLDYSELLNGLRLISEYNPTFEIDIQLFDLRTGKTEYKFDNGLFPNTD
jgi:hypothetical protein